MSQKEFFLPTGRKKWQDCIDDADPSALHHLARYQWAVLVAESLQPLSMIDIACGSGYGTVMLAESLPNATVLGVDKDIRAVEESNSRPLPPNCSFVVGDLTDWSFDLNGLRQKLPFFDLVVSFDTIEHLNHRDLAWLAFQRSLNQGGTLLLSTPVLSSGSDVSPKWFAHEIEYGVDDLIQIAKNHFSSVLQVDDEGFPAGEFWGELNADKVRYWNNGNPLVLRN